MLLISEIDEARRRVSVRAEGVDYGAFFDFFRDLFITRPQLATFDFICERPVLSGEVTTDMLLGLKEAYDRTDPQPGPYTAVVSDDPFIRDWAGGLSGLLAGRIFKVCASVEEATAFLDEVDALRR